jgi:hypothetical protein
VGSCGGAVAGLAEVSLVARRDKAGDELALAASERSRFVQQDVGQLAHGFRGFRAVRETRADAGQAFGKIDVGHAGLLSDQWSVFSSQLPALGLPDRYLRTDN